MNSRRILILSLVAGCCAGFAATTASAIDYKACIAKCKDQRCRDGCEQRVNDDNARESAKHSCAMIENPKTHVFAADPNCMRNR